MKRSGQLGRCYCVFISILVENDLSSDATELLAFLGNGVVMGPGR